VPVSLEAQVALTLGRLELEAELAVATGELVVLLGPNGAGKTTLLRALAGLVALERGRVVLDGEVLEDTAAGTWVPTEARPIGFVFQDYLLFPHLSALENVAFGLRARGLAKAEARKRASGWLEWVGLAEHAGSRPRALSGGQAQRVALARGLVARPRVLFADEPTGALDSLTGEQVMDLMVAVAREEGTTVVLVTHEPRVAAYADREVVVRDGRVHSLTAGAVG
jgi:ABC-type sulfate/molybdate transport systems ATPase subunit